MTSDPVTLTLPFLTWQYVLLSALCFLTAIVLIGIVLKGSDRLVQNTANILTPVLAFGLGVLWFLLLGAALWGLWQVFGGVEGATLSDTSFGLGALIAAFLGAPFVIYGTWLKHKTNRLEQEGHMTDRITKAVEQLGAEKTVKVQVRTLSWKLPGSDKLYETRVRLGEQSEGPADSIVVDAGKWDVAEETLPNLEVRIGAILSLERIAQDSTIHDKGRDHVRVMEILCAYIRENSRGADAKESLRTLYEKQSEDPDMPEDQFRAWFCKHHGFSEPDLEDRISVEATKRWAANLPKPRADVQLALKVIGRRNADQRQVEAAWPDVPTSATVWPFEPDFKRPPDKRVDAPLNKAKKEAFKDGLEAWGAKLRNYRGYRLDLRGANLQGADMAAKQPDASDAVFSGARLDGTRLEGASLWGARIEGANLFEARMEGADLSEARLECAELTEARIEGADLSLARMEGTDLSGARMEGADLLLVRMEGAYLWDARLEGANLSQVRMDKSTTLTLASFRGSALRCVDFTAVPLFEPQILSCFGDASVILPQYIPRPDHWPDWKLPDLFGEHAFETEWRKWQTDPETYTPPPKPK